MKYLKPLLITSLVIGLATLSYVFLVDDELHPDIQPILDEYNNNYTTVDNGSVYQLGMWVSEQMEPYEAGLLRLQQYNDALAAADFNPIDVKYDDIDQSEWIEQLYPADQTTKLLCEFDSVECLNFIYHDPSGVEQLINENQKYIARYDELMTFEKFELFAPPSYSAPMISFGPNLDILKIKLIDTIYKIKKGQRQEAQNNLISLITHHKRVLAQTPYIVPKITSDVELGILLDTLPFLLLKDESKSLVKWQKTINTLTTLDTNQLSLKDTLLTDFSASANSLVSLSHDQLAQRSPELFLYFPTSLLYKKNKSLNQLYAGYFEPRPQIKFVGDKIETFMGRNYKEVIYVDYSNFIGSTLVSLALPRFLNAESDIYIVEIKQRMIKFLFNQKLTNRPQASTFISPYTGTPAFIQDDKFCVDGEKGKEDAICIYNF